MSNNNTNKKLKLNSKATVVGASALLATTLVGCGAALDSIVEQVQTEAANTVQTVNEPVVEAQATSTPIPTATLIPTVEVVSTGQYVDGEYLGDSYRADRWGNVQVRAIIENGELVNIEIVDYPRSTGHSDGISRRVLPVVMSEAIQIQSADVDIISGATPTVQAFISSLESALDDAVVSTY